MATITATISPVTFPAATAVSAQKRTRVKFISGLNSFGGLKACNNVASLGLPIGTEQSFAKIVSSLKKKSSLGRGCGALTSTCSAVEEIFRIAAIIPGLVLIGVAVGFVLLRVEAFVEEE
ncbi:hypothetical protein F511_33561 [Dorcoceras hygrometricum]|uniref:Cytochrome b6-f complex subunit 7 n=1 Tax=Dorcoceras hygrometricum TaxID=472368 RepID=A0A2Z7C3U2_9LAMI|nr:hypothetical protein F511_33561 [Dorcoceras hygrometricum]